MGSATIEDTNEHGTDLEVVPLDADLDVAPVEVPTTSKAPAKPRAKGKAPARQRASGDEPRKNRKQVSLHDDVQELIWEASELLGMENSPTVRAALKLLIQQAERRGIRRKTDDEVIADLLGGSK